MWWYIQSLFRLVVTSENADMNVQRDNLQDASPDTANAGDSNGDKKTTAIVKPPYLYRYKNNMLFYSEETASKLKDLGFPYLLIGYSFNNNVERSGEVEEASIDLEKFVGGKENQLSEESLVFLVAFLTQFIDKKEEEYADIIFSKKSAKLYKKDKMCIRKLLNTANVCLLEGVAVDALVIFLTSSIRKATTASMRNRSCSKKRGRSTELSIDSVIEILWGGNREFADRGVMLMKFVHFYCRQDDETERFRRKKITMPELLDGIYYKEEADGTGLRKMNINERREEGKDGPIIIKYFERNEEGMKICIWGRFPREGKVVNGTFNIPKRIYIHLNSLYANIDALRETLEIISQRHYKVSEVRIHAGEDSNGSFSGNSEKKELNPLNPYFDVLRWLRLQNSLSVLEIVCMDVNVHMIEMIHDIIVNNKKTLSKLMIGNLYETKMRSRSFLEWILIEAGRFCDCPENIKHKAMHGTGTCVHIAASKIIDTILTLENLECLNIAWLNSIYSMESINRFFLWLEKSRVRTLTIRNIHGPDDDDAVVLTMLIKRIMGLPGIRDMHLEWNMYNAMYRAIDASDNIKLLMTNFRRLTFNGSDFKATERQNEVDGETIVTEYLAIEVSNGMFYSPARNYFNRLKDFVAEAGELKTLNIISETMRYENIYGIELARCARSIKELQIGFDQIHSHQRQYHAESTENLEGIEVLLVRNMKVTARNLPILNGFISYFPNLKIMKVCHKHNRNPESSSKMLREIWNLRFAFKSYSEENKESTFVVES